MNGSIAAVRDGWTGTGNNLFPIRGGDNEGQHLVPPEERLVSVHQLHWPSSNSSTRACREHEV